MKKNILLILIIILMLGAMIFCYFNFNKSNSIVEINLKSNPTTGYGWIYSLSNPEVLEIVEDKYTQDSNFEGASGVGGINKYVFKAVNEGKTIIEFKYLRSWENKKELYNIVYTIEVDKNLDIKVLDESGDYSTEIPKAIVK